MKTNECFKNCALIIVCAVFLSGLSGTVFAQEEQYFRNTAEGYMRFLPYSSVNHQDGKLQFFETGAMYKYEITTKEAQIKKIIPMNLSVGFDDVEIGKDDLKVQLPTRLVTWKANVGVTVPFFNIDKMYIGAGISPCLVGDNWDMDIDDLRIPMRAYLVYRHSEKLMFVAGVSVKPKYEFVVWPIVGFIYKPNEQWEINFLSKKPKVLYHFDEKLSLFAEGDFAYGEYVVKNLDAKHAVLRYQNYHVGGGASYKILDNIKVTASCGGHFGGILKYKEKDRGKINLGNGMYVDCRIAIQF